MNLMRAVFSLLLFLLFPVFSFAQNPTPGEIKDFIQVGPWIPVLETAPDNALTTASLTKTYTGQPSAAQTIKISGAKFPAETYEWYANGGTYTGDNIGVEIGGSADASYGNLEDAINESSNFVTAVVTAGSDTLKIQANMDNFPGIEGNYINVLEAVSNLPAYGNLAGGASVRAGRVGSIVAVVDDGAVNLWVKVIEGTLTDDSWVAITELTE